MPSRLTVADVRTAFWQIVDPSNNNSSLFLPALNEVSERVIESGLWKGVNFGVEFPSTTGYVTLPRRASSILGYVVDNIPRAVYGRVHEFQPMGPGFYDRINYDLGLFLDQGEFPTQVVQDEALTIRLTIANAADAAKTVRLYGVDANGDTIFDATGKEGIALTLANPTVDSSVPMIVTAVDKAVTLGTVTISTVDGGTVTPLSTYEPTETNPLYRRYKVGTIAARGDGEPVVRALVKRKFVTLVNETDLVYPDSLGGLKFGLLANRLEYNGVEDIAQAEAIWMKCYDVLNRGLTDYRGGIRKPIPFSFNSAGSTQVTR